jgi:pullulanase
MKKIIPAIGFIAATIGLLATSGIFSGSVASNDDGFVDPIQYAEAPALDKVLKADDDEEGTYDIDSVIIHYHNDDKKCANRRFWLWVTGVDGAEYTADTSTQTDLTITLDYKGDFSSFAGQDGVYLIIKNAGTWDGQSEDTFISFDEIPPVDGVVEFWLIPGVGNALEICKTEEETKSDRVTEAYFTDFKTITVKATAAVKVYRIYAFEQTYLSATVKAQEIQKPLRLLKTGSSTTATFNIKLNYNAHINVQYVIETEYEAWPGRMHSAGISFNKLYTNSRFHQYYEYSGTDLGVTYTPEASTFKLWAPTSGNVKLNVYRKGTAKSDDPEKGGYGNNIKTTYAMTYMQGGVWAATVTGDQNGKYYTYEVTNSNGTNEVVDPYAKACGANGRRGMILDFDSTDPEGWSAIDGKWDGKAGYDITTPQQLSIYESHIRDLTMHETWNGKEKPGTYKAYIERGTSYTKSGKTVKTGFDHLEELGVNAIQLTPVFDHDNIEYFKQPNPDGTYTLNEGSYNWGYNPLNFNCVEGQYSSNPNYGENRVKEFKELILACAKNANKTRVIMDVVYNHVSSGSNSNFTKIMPGYYFRLTANGEYYNGSGCGNEVKTEAPMMRKFIIDSLCWWAKEYNIKGFRFDLMGLIDYVTLKEAAQALYKIDPDILLYGEGWTGDGSDAHIDQKTYKTWGANTYVTYRDLKPASGQCMIACFNDTGRNNLKGSNDLGWGDTTRKPGYGFMSQGSGDVGTKSDEVGWMLLGKNTGCTAYPTTNGPKMTVNYASCHDNYSLFDQYSSTLCDGTTLPTAAKLAKAVTSTNIAIMLSNGIAFMQGGEELFRTKIEYETEKTRIPDDCVLINGIYISHNAYKSSDRTNAFDWSRKISLTYKSSTENNIYDNYFTQLAKVIKDRRNLSYKNTSANSGTCNFFGSGSGKTVVGWYIGTTSGGYVMGLGGRAQSSFSNPSKTSFAKVGTASGTGSSITVGQYSCGVFVAA